MKCSEALRYFRRNFILILTYGFFAVSMVTCGGGENALTSLSSGGGVGGSGGSGGGGVTVPQRSAGAPAGILSSATVQTTASLTTDVPAVCKYSATPNTDYSAMSSTFDVTGGTLHSTTLTGLTSGSTYNYYVRCQDLSGNPNTGDYLIAFSIANTATSYYADSASGSDSNSGSISSPWKTLEYGMKHIGPGDTLYLRQGTYPNTSGGYIDVWSSAGDDGAAGAFKTVKSYPGETATVTGSMFISANYWRIEGLNFPSTSIMIANEAIRISQNNWATLNFPADWVHDIQIVGNTFSGTFGTSAVQAWASNLLVENNDLSNISSTAAHPKGLGLYICSGDNLVIRGNVIQGNGAYAIQVFDQRRASGETFERKISNVTVENNVIYRNPGNTTRGIIISAQSGTGSYSHTTGENAIVRNNVIYGVTYNGILIDSGFNGVKVYNNTIYNTESDGILFRNIAAGFSTNVEVKNNIIDLGSFYASYDHINMGGSDGAVTIDNNLYYPGPAKLSGGASDAGKIEADPMFVNAAANDFRLQLGSPAINQGLTLTEATTDKDGFTRPSGFYDLGAYEYH